MDKDAVIPKAGKIYGLDVKTEGKKRCIKVECIRVKQNYEGVQKVLVRYFYDDDQYEWLDGNDEKAMKRLKNKKKIQQKNREEIELGRADPYDYKTSRRKFGDYLKSTGLYDMFKPIFFDMQSCTATAGDGSGCNVEKALCVCFYPLSGIQYIMDRLSLKVSDADSHNKLGEMWREGYKLGSNIRRLQMEIMNLGQTPQKYISPEKMEELKALEHKKRLEKIDALKSLLEEIVANEGILAIFGVKKFTILLDTPENEELKKLTDQFRNKKRKAMKMGEAVIKMKERKNKIASKMDSANKKVRAGLQKQVAQLDGKIGKMDTQAQKQSDQVDDMEDEMRKQIKDKLGFTIEDLEEGDEESETMVQEEEESEEDSASDGSESRSESQSDASS